MYVQALNCAFQFWPEWPGARGGGVKEVWFLGVFRLDNI